MAYLEIHCTCTSRSYLSLGFTEKRGSLSASSLISVTISEMILTCFFQRSSGHNPLHATKVANEIDELQEVVQYGLMNLHKYTNSGSVVEI